MNSKLIFLCSSLLSLRFEKCKSSEFLGGGATSPTFTGLGWDIAPPCPPRRRHCKEKANKIQLMEHYILKQVLNKHLRYWGAGLKPKFLEYFKLDIQTIPTPSQYKDLSWLVFISLWFQWQPKVTSCAEINLWILNLNPFPPNGLICAVSKSFSFVKIVSKMLYL